jgi:hypothetical protein
MPKELDKGKILKTRDELRKLAEIAEREGFETFGEKISGIAEEASRMVAEQNTASLAEQYVPA